MAFSLFFPKEVAPNPLYRYSPLSHEVPIATVRDGMYILSDYTMVAVFKVKGAEYDLADIQETAAYVDSLKSMLNALNPGVQLKVIHRISHFYRDWLEDHVNLLNGPNTFARFVAFQEAQRYYRMMEERQLLRSENFVCLSYKPNIQWWKQKFTWSDLKIAFKGLTESSAVVQRTLRQYEEARLKFEAIIRPVIQGMTFAGLQPERMDDAALYDLAWKTLNPKTSLKHACPEIELPDPRDPYAGIFAEKALAEAVKDPRKRGLITILPLTEREQLCQADWKVYRNYVYTDGMYYGCVVMRKLPTHVFPSMAIRLASLPFESTVSIDCYMLQKHKELDKQLADAKAQKGRAGATMFEWEEANPVEMEKAQDIEQEAMALSDPTENPFRFRMVVLVSAASPKELDDRCDAVKTLFRELDNMEGMREEFGVHVMLKSTWPFSSITDLNSRKARTSQIACLLPIFSRWEGSHRPVALLMDRMGRLVRHDPFPSNLPSKNRLVAGKTGSGKSFTMQLADMQPFAALDNVEILSIESGESFANTCRCFGGRHIRLGPRAGLHLNPFDLPPGFDEMDPTEQEAQLRYKYGFISKLVLTMADLTSRDEIKIAENVIGMVTQRLYSSVRTPRMRDFFRILGQYSNPEDPDAEKVAKRVRTLIRQYVLDEATGEAGQYADMFDCFTDFDVEVPWINFDLTDVASEPALMAPMMIQVMMGYVYNKVLSRDGKQRLLVFDEAWKLIKDNKDGSPSIAAEALETFWREVRKYGASATMITQSFGDMTDGKIGKAIVANSPVWYLLAHERGSAANEEAFRGAGFSPSKIREVYDLKTEYGSFSEIMIKEGNEWGIVRLPSAGIKYWLATTSPEDQKILKKYREIYEKGYELPLHVVMAIVSEDYPTGAHGIHRKQMSEAEALDFAQKFQEKLARFESLTKQGKKIPFDFR